MECKPQSYSMLLKSFGNVHHHRQATTTESHVDLKQLEEILSRLEEERLKIDAFKRELPLSMQLLTTAVEASRQQLQAYRSSNGNNQEPIKAVLEEFIPLKNAHSEGSEQQALNSDQANWMTSVQLWSQAADATKPKEQGDNVEFNVTSPKLALDTKQQRSYGGGGGAFHLFSKDILNTVPSQLLLPELALGSPENKLGKKMVQENKCSEFGENNTTQDQQGKVEGQTSTITATNTSTSNQNSSHRKARLCWSPDLHRRFVSALQMLGGSQVATPKQIRELMKVDGLTNDEVKSHLQKYRLHTRRPNAAAGGARWHLGSAGVCNRRSQWGAIHPASHAPTHYRATPMPQDFYTTAMHQPQSSGHHQLHHLTLHHQLHMYRAAGTTSRTQSSPELDPSGNGGQSESVEDARNLRFTTKIN